MAQYITLADVKPRLIGFSEIVRDPADPAIGATTGVDADGFPTRYTKPLENIIAGTIAAIDNVLKTEFDGKDNQRRFFWSDEDWDIDIPRARAITKIEMKTPETIININKTNPGWETLPSYNTYDVDGIRRIRRKGDSMWECGEYFITGNWGYSVDEVPADIKDGAIDQVHYRFSMLPAIQMSPMNTYSGGEPMMYGGMMWSGQMYGTLMHHATARGLV